jgi:ubiquinol-cytochrome c reductase hinge protein
MENKDPIEVFRSKCKKSKDCNELLTKLMECEKRVQGENSQEQCTEEFIDFSICVDKCVTAYFVF